MPVAVTAGQTGQRQGGDRAQPRRMWSEKLGCGSVTARIQLAASAVGGRYPAALALVAVLAVRITRIGDLRAISAASSAGFLLVFAALAISSKPS